MSQFFTLLTKTGQGLLANAIAYGQPLTIATMAIGDGGGKLPTPDASTTRLINEVRRGPINQTSVDDNNPNWTVVEQVLPPDVGGWTIREIGLYDTDGNLIAYGNYPETYKPQLSEGSARTQTIRFVMEVTDTSAVTLKIDPSVVMASRKYVDDAVEAHEKSRNHPYADTANQGMVKFATLQAAKTGTDGKTALTPAGGKAQLDDHRKEKEAHNAAQIALEALLKTFGDAKTVQSALALLGSAALKQSNDFAAAGHSHDSVTNPASDRITISATGNLDHYVGGEYVFRVNSAGKIDRASGGIDASLLTDKAKVAVIPHMIGADGRGWCGLVNDPNDEKYLGALRLSGAGTFYYQYGGSTKFQVTSDGRVDTYGDLTGAGNLKMTGGQWTLGNMSGDGASLYMDGSRWAYASDYRIALNPGQSRTVTTAFGAFEVRTDGNVAARATIDGDDIIASGSNSNGIWSRSYDGTLRCSIQQDATYSTRSYLRMTWNFPAQYRVKPHVVVSWASGSAEFNPVKREILPASVESKDYPPGYVNIAVACLDSSGGFVKGDTVQINGMAHGVWK